MIDGLLHNVLLLGRNTGFTMKKQPMYSSIQLHEAILQCYIILKKSNLLPLVKLH